MNRVKSWYNKINTAKERDVMDKLVESEIKIIEEIIRTKDGPTLMINLNRYKEGLFPFSDVYLKWKEVNERMIDSVGGKILWRLPVLGQLLTNNANEPIDEIIAYWYPSHQSLLATRGTEITKLNFELRQDLIDYAIIHRVDGQNPPIVG